MGIHESPDISQEIMESLFRELDEVDTYINDIGVFSDSWKDHLASLEKVLTIMQSSNFAINLSNVNGVLRKQIGSAPG